ncbi:hypothetical protein GZL_00139 [Streptomyces sp. 769]|nr:hypothetical protein GZL_00139 [Streptomyces sp. 769]
MPPDPPTRPPSDLVEKAGVADPIRAERRRVRRRRRARIVWFRGLRPSN